MRQVDLGSVRVTLGQPRQVVAMPGFCWFPHLVQFPTGEILLNHELVEDTDLTLVSGCAYFSSSDGGQTWGKRYEVAGGLCSGRVVMLAGADGAIVGPTYFGYPEPADQARAFAADYVRFEDGGRRYILEPWSVRVEGLPRDVAPIASDPRWGRRWPARFYFWGEAVDVGGEWLRIAYVQYLGDRQYTAIALRSADEGRSWRYISTFVEPGEVPEANEGPSEASVATLANGDVMAVIRIGAGRDQPIVRRYSADGGLTWSAIDRLPAFSVDPCLRRLAGGVLALAAGRPGMYVWLATDGVGRDWQMVDVIDHHNKTMGLEHQIRLGLAGRHAEDPYQTTGYPEMIEVAPNRLLLTYDRVPFGWEPVPLESEERNRIYVVEIDVELT